MNVPFYRDGRTATVSVRRIVSSTRSLAGDQRQARRVARARLVPPAGGRRGAAHARRSARRCCCRSSRSRTRRARARGGDRPGLGHVVARAARQPDARAARDDRDRARDDRARRGMFYPANRRVFDDPALDVRHRRREGRTSRSQGDTYDLILSEPSNPWVSGVSGLFTTEFYAHVARFLTPRRRVRAVAAPLRDRRRAGAERRARRAPSSFPRTRSTPSAVTTSSSSRRSSRRCRSPTGRCSSIRAPRRISAACCRSRRRS